MGVGQFGVFGEVTVQRVYLWWLWDCGGCWGELVCRGWLCGFCECVCGKFWSMFGE